MKDEFRVVGVRFPALGDRWNHLARNRVIFGEPLIEREVDAGFGLAGAYLRIERLGLRARNVPQLLSGGWFGFAEIRRAVGACRARAAEHAEQARRDGDRS